MKSFSFLFLVFFYSSASWSQDFQVPALKSHVNDYASVLSRGAENQINSILGSVKNQTGIELAVLTVSSLRGNPIEMASIQVTDQWKLGTASGDKGLLLFLAIEDRKIRIEVGQGLEGNLTDAASKMIIDQTMVPLLKSQDYASAVLVGTFQMLSQAAPETDFKAFYENVDPSALQTRGSRGSKRGNLLVILFWIFIIIFGGRSGFLPLLLLGGMGGHRGGGGFGGGMGGGGGFSGGGASGGW